MANRINREWHENNVMPKNPTMEVRIEWHRAHQAACGCRKIPDKVMEAMLQRPEPKVKNG